MKEGAHGTLVRDEYVGTENIYIFFLINLTKNNKNMIKGQPHSLHGHYFLMGRTRLEINFPPAKIL